MSKKKQADPEPLVEPEPKVEHVETGEGEFIFSNGATYRGQWKCIDGAKFRAGEGVYCCGPENYSGQWVNDCMEGNGKYTFSSGAVYEGEFQNNMFEGSGTYRFADGATYSGSWHQNKMHGEGVYTDADKVSISGNFFNGLYNSGKSYISVRPVKSFQN